MDSNAIACFWILDELGEPRDELSGLSFSNLVDGRAHFPKITGSEMCKKLGGWRFFDIRWCARFLRFVSNSPDSSEGACVLLKIPGCGSMRDRSVIPISDVEAAVRAKANIDGAEHGVVASDEISFPLEVMIPQFVDGV